MQSKLHQQILKTTKLSIKEIDELLTKGVNKSIPSKKLLVKPKQPVRDAYYLKSGIIRHYIIGKNGKEFTKNFIRGPRFMLPSLSDFFLRSPASIYCESLTNLEVIHWDYQTIISFAEAHPTFYKYLLAGVVQAFRGKEQKEIALNQLDAKTRYLHFLDQYPGLVNEISIQYVASYLNIRPETLSRIRAKLF